MRALLLTFALTRLVNFPICVGMVPSRLLLYKALNKTQNIQQNIPINASLCFYLFYWNFLKYFSDNQTAPDDVLPIFCPLEVSIKGEVIA